MITTAEFLRAAAIATALIAAIFIVASIPPRRRAQRAAYYSTRREAHHHAVRRLSTALTLFVIAGGLTVVSAFLPPEQLQPAPLPAVLIPTGTPRRQPTVFIVPTATDTPTPVTPTPEPSPTSRPMTAPIIIPTKPADNANTGKHLTLRAISSAIDETGLPIHPTTEFTTGVPTIYIFFDFTQAPKEARLRHTWFRDGGSVHFESAEWTQPGDGAGHISWSPEHGFQPGLYEVRVLLGNTKQFTANFMVH